MTPVTKKRAIGGVLVAALLAGGGYAIYRSHQASSSALLPPAPAHADPLDAVPHDAMLLVTVDLTALRKSPLGDALAGPGGQSWLGDVKATCGFEPFDSLEQLALVVPPGGGEGDFGIVGAGTLDQAALLECAGLVISGRGGKPIATAVGSFKSVRDVSQSSGRGAAGEIAVRPGGPLLIGSGEFLRTMIDTADGALPSVRTNQAHAALRAALEESAVLKLSLVLSPVQRATIADEVDRSRGKAPAALKGVVAAALGAKVTSETVQLRAVILVADEQQARDLGDTLDALRKERSDNTILKLLGIGSLLERVRVTLDGKEIHVELDMTVGEARSLVDKLASASDPKPLATVSAPAPMPAPSAGR